MADISAALDVAGLPRLLALPAFAHLDRAMVGEVVSEFGRFAGEVVAPTDTPGDRSGSRLDGPGGAVVTPPGFREAYRRYLEAGWGSLPFPESYGGSGFPWLVALALQEMFASANLALSVNAVLTQAGAELLLTSGDDRQRRLYLPRLVAGEWPATMEMTEPDAGSDLGALSATAKMASDGTWRVSGTKIFATWAEHDLAGNIVHFVLARTVGAPPGTRGLSVFLVPKFLPDASGAPGEANSLSCTRLEEKLGIHASPTCVMEYEGASGELVGPLHGGLAVMFTMMNAARLSIGAEGPAVGERAFQQAYAYALERRQGHRPGVPAGERASIIAHPDVKRMLLEMRTRVLAARALAFSTAAQRDLARCGTGEAERARAGARLDLFVPVAKAWGSEQGFIVSSLGLQVHGGVGYLEDANVPQRLRDARVGPVYEGTNGIQAIDLVMRKVPRGHDAVAGLLGEIASTAGELPLPELAPAAEALREAVKALAEATGWVQERRADRPDDVLAGASAYLELAGTTIGGWLLAKRALLALRGDPAAERAAGEANFFAVEAMSAAPSLLRRATAGSGRLAALARPPVQGAGP